MTNAAHAYGTTITLAGNTIADLNNIGGVEVTLETVDVTTHQSANAYREYIGSLLDTSEIPISGFFYPGDTNGQIALTTQQNARTAGAFVITLPTAFGTTWTFNAFVTKTKPGEMAADGSVPFSASLKPTGKPVLAITASNNITVLVCTDNTGVATFYPAFAAATYEYVVVTAAAAVSYTLTATFAAGTCTLEDGNGGTQTLLTTVASSSIDIDGTSFHTDVLTVKETGKTAKIYKLHIQND